MDIYKEMRDILSNSGIVNDENSFGDEYFSDEIFKILKTDTRNVKGEDFIGRFRDIISDPNNLFIKRNENSGKVQNGIVTLHNDIRVYDRCYYDNFSDILKLNRGVHEPSEERSFDKVLKHIKPGATMIELGSYWSFYSIWFLKTIENGKSFCIEPDQKCLSVGINNFKLNGLNGDFTRGFIGNNNLNLVDYFTEKNIDYVDILHSDIQGYELEMLHQVSTYFSERKIKYIFISTHSNPLHYSCIDFLKSHNYKILCSCDYDSETFQFDGFILSCPEELNEIKPFEVGSREYSKILSVEYFNKIRNNY